MLHGPTVYNGHLTLTPVAGRHYLFLWLKSVASRNRTPLSRTRGERSSFTPLRRFAAIWLQYSQYSKNANESINLSILRSIRPTVKQMDHCNVWTGSFIWTNLSWKHPWASLGEGDSHFFQMKKYLILIKIIMGLLLINVMI